MKTEYKNWMPAGMVAGFGYFSSEIGPATLFAAYKFIKQAEKKGASRDEICDGLKEKFGEKNPDVKVQ